jgi:hypothetical protein
MSDSREEDQMDDSWLSTLLCDTVSWLRRGYVPDVTNNFLVRLNLIQS